MKLDIFDERGEAAENPFVSVMDQLLPDIDLELVPDWPTKLIEACIRDFGEDR